MNPPSENEFKLFTCSYRHQGKEWSVDFPAVSFADAKARLSAMHFGKVDGIVVATIPAKVGPVNSGFVVRSAVRFRNFLDNTLFVAKSVGE